MDTLYKVNKSGTFQVWYGETSGGTYTVHYGLENGKMQSKTTTVTPKNVGKANATTPEQQSELELKSAYSKQYDKGYRLTKEDALEADCALPMLAQDYLKKSHMVKFPCYVSKKLDGVRCFANTESISLTSRMGKPYLLPPQIEGELKLLKQSFSHSLLDGELYSHGVPLQLITGAAKKMKPLTLELEYHVFDVPMRFATFENRLGALERLSQLVQSLGLRFIKVVPYKRVDSLSEARAVMDEYLQEGYEGLMFRNLSGKYEYGKRSNDLLKWKDFQDMEVRILTVKEDKNKEGVYTCALKGGKVVDCKMVGSHEERLYTNCIKNIGRWITLKYQALTMDRIPQFPVGIAFRECDDKGNPVD